MDSEIKKIEDEVGDLEDHLEKHTSDFGAALDLNHKQNELNNLYNKFLSNE